MTASRPSQPSPPERAEATARPLRVVIAEDAALFREGLARLLADRGHQVVAAQADGRPQPLVGVRRRHPDVDHGHVGMAPRHRVKQRAAVGNRRAHLVAAVLEQPHQPGPEQDGVFGDHDPQRH